MMMKWFYVWIRSSFASCILYLENQSISQKGNTAHQICCTQHVYLVGYFTKNISGVAHLQRECYDGHTNRTANSAVISQYKYYVHTIKYNVYRAIFQLYKCTHYCLWISCQLQFEDEFAWDKSNSHFYFLPIS